jgi:hypothetical protein
VAGIVAVTAGGSAAGGTADAASDLDLGLLYDGEAGFDLAALRRLASEVDDRHEVTLTEPGGWGPRINGGGWLLIEGRRVDWLYREIGAVSRAIDDVRRGASPLHYQPGHPFGWQAQMYAGEIAHGIALEDRAGRFAELHARALPYPEALRGAKLAELWEASFALDVAAKPAARGDVAYVAGCLWRAAAVIVQALFALNRRYLLNEKGATRLVGGFALAPRDVTVRVEAALGAVGRSPNDLAAAIEQLRRLTGETEVLAAVSGR